MSDPIDSGMAGGASTEGHWLPDHRAFEWRVPLFGFTNLRIQHEGDSDGLWDVCDEFVLIIRGSEDLDSVFNAINERAC